jgi:hypothetical protein
MTSKFVVLCSLGGTLILIGCGVSGDESLSSASAGDPPRKEPGINREQGKIEPVSARIIDR